MACLGVHFALSPEDVTALLSQQSDEERLAFLQEQVEARYFEEPCRYIAESDKAWDAMHRAFSGGSLNYESGSYPLNHVVLGGQPLYGSGDYIMSLKQPEQVKDVARSIVDLTQEQFRSLYNTIDSQEYGYPLGEDDFQYTWEWFQGVRALYQIACLEGRHVLFTADQ